MTEVRLTSSQIVDAAGAFAETVRSEAGTAQFAPNNSPIPCPDYDTAAAYFGLDGMASNFAVAPADLRLAMFGGLRVQIGVQTSDRRSVHLPGIVLPDNRNGVRIGCLSGPDIIRDHNAPLTDLQQVLLEQIAAMHMPGVGEHASNQAVNAGDIGHAALIAVTSPNALNGIHERVHSFVGSGLSQSVARTGALTISRGHDARVVSEIIVPAAQAATIIVPKHYQMPSGLSLGASDAAVGVTLAAVRSQGNNYPQPDLASNAAAVVAQGV